MIPAWKLKRELRRGKEQILGAYGKLIGRSRTARYDARRDTDLSVTDGKLELSPKVAIVVVFQTGVLPESILLTCQTLLDTGFTPLIVSNGPLAAGQADRLAPLCWRIVERPNMGYDFGGYREGVMQLLDATAQIDELIIMNDSVWVIPSIFGRFIEKLRGLQGGLAGNVTRAKRGMVWIESYFFLVDGKTFESQTFRDYWLNYHLIDSKYVVIRRGERGFSVAMAQGGIKVVANANINDFCARVRELSNDDLALAFKYFNDEDQEISAQAQAIADAPERGLEWRTKALSFIDQTLLERRMWISSFPIVGHQSFDNPFIKKGRTRFAWGWRSRLLAATEAGDMEPLDPVILDEIVQLNDKGFVEGPQWINTDRK